MSYKDDLLYKACRKGKQIKNFFLVKTLFPSQNLWSCYNLICLIQPEQHPPMEKGMDFS